MPTEAGNIGHYPLTLFGENIFHMLTNLIVLGVSLTLIIWRYSKSFEQGLTWTVFLIVVLPGSVSLELGSSLPSLTFHRLALLITLLKWHQERSVPKPALNAPFCRIVFFSAAFFFVSTCLSSYLFISLKQFTYYVFEFVLFFFIIQTSSSSRALSEKMISALGFGLLTVSFLAFAERYAGIRISTLLPYAGSDYGVSRFAWAGLDDDAITVSYRHRILFGVACAIGTLKFLVDCAFQPTKRAARKRLFYVFVCGAALYFSVSRGPWLAFLFACVILVFALPRRFLKPAATLVGLTAVIFIVRPGIWTTISNLGQTTMDETSVRGSSFRWREQVFELAISKIVDSGPLHFLFGYGGGSTIMTDFGKLETSAGDSLPMESWDCEIAIILYERGVIGFLLIVALFAGTLFRITRLMITLRDTPDPLLTFLCGALAVICFMMSNVAIYAIQLIYIEAMLLGISSRYLQTQSQYRPFTAAEIEHEAYALNGTR
jgi:O-antigen ligase